MVYFPSRRLYTARGIKITFLVALVTMFTVHVIGRLSRKTETFRTSQPLPHRVASSNQLHLLQQERKTGPSSFTSASNSLASNKSWVTGRRECTPVKNYLLLKTHKCASTTVQNIAFRFAFRNNLTTVLASPGNFFGAIGWPKKPLESHIVPHPQNRQFDVAATHMIYDKDFIRRFLAPGAKGFGMLREPLSQFHSLWNYFVYQTFFHQTMEQFLDNPFVYPSKIQLNYPNQGPIAVRNFQAVQYGFDEKDFDNITATERFIRDIDEDFTLLLLVEYLDESLVLLMRKMCWSYLDITQLFLNRSVSKSNLEPTTKQRENHKKWSSVDYYMYSHFNQTLWTDISSEPNFEADLQGFQEIRKQVTLFCSSQEKQSITVRSNLAGVLVTIDRLYCKSLSITGIEWSKRFAARQHPNMSAEYFGTPT